MTTGEALSGEQFRCICADDDAGDCYYIRHMLIYGADFMNRNGQCKCACHGTGRVAKEVEGG